MVSRPLTGSICIWPNHAPNWSASVPRRSTIAVGVQPKDFSKPAVIGAGTMGGGIAMSFADFGYDVADYEAVHPSYGTLDDVRRFLAEAHRRGLRVIGELVINHTSDQHAWFQRARRAPRDSSERAFYLWSDTTDRFAGARIIFRDTESSNWSWDAIARQYYWHRFFYHQPDLNFDNPDVEQAVLQVMRFWLDLGLDGLRLDAIAHLYEREGTSCDNLSETHAFIKRARQVLDREYADRVLLAEVNAPAAITREYFGDGDECHMCFHFPLMPRLFQALATEMAAPIEAVVRATMGLPPGCQWAIFLRNHDELTLSALALEDREPLFAAYAPVPRMRLNNGIRRRLAPLTQVDRHCRTVPHAGTLAACSTLRSATLRRRRTSPPSPSSPRTVTR